MKHQRKTLVAKHTHAHTHKHTTAMQKHNKKIIIASMVVVGAGLVLGLVFTSMDFAPSNAPPPENPQSIVAYTKDSALPANFPPELVLGANGATFEVAQFSGQNTVDANGAVVVWRSSSTMADLSSEYRSYFSSHGWTVTGEDSGMPGMPNARLLVATRESAKAVVSISSDVAGARVTAEYYANR